jgi:pimeloyl-ACP methyl ester carboxylesterase
LAIVTVSALALLLSRRDGPPTVPARAKAGDLSLERVEFKIRKERYQAERGVLVVPENRADERSRLIALPVLRIHARALRPAEPIFWFSGGPGTSNMTVRPPARLLDDHDFVIVGYRGVDGSVRLDSPEIAQAMRGADHDLSGAASIAGFRAAVAAFVEESRAKGVDLRGYTLLEVIADNETARSALGYERIDLFSTSYGTRLAQIYAVLHPEVVFRSVMIGVNPPGHFAWDPRVTDAQLAHLSRLCARDPHCGTRTPDLKAAMRRVLAQLPTRYAGLRLDAGKLRAITFLLLFQRSTMALAADAYVAADRGDYSGLALMQLAYDAVLPGMSTWGEFVCKGYNGDFDPTRDYLHDFATGDTVLGSPISRLVFGAAGAIPVPMLPPELRKPRDSAVETLLLSGNLDVSTPAEAARDELLPHLSRGRQIILSEMGHVADVWGLQHDAFQHVLVTFYATGVADDSRFVPAPMDFRVKWGLPLLAKLAAAATAAVATAAIVLVAWLIRRRALRPAASGFARAS